MHVSALKSRNRKGPQLQSVNHPNGLDYRRALQIQVRARLPRMILLTIGTIAIAMTFGMAILIL